MQDDFFSETVGLKSDDPNFDAVKTDLKGLYGENIQRVQAIFDNKLVKSDKIGDQLTSFLGDRYFYQTDDCNIVFEFDPEDNFNLFLILTPELCPFDNVYDEKGKRITDPAKIARARMEIEQNNAYPVGQCSMLKYKFKKYIDKGGKLLSLDEIAAYKEEEKEEIKQMNSEKAKQNLMNDAIANNRDLAIASGILANPIDVTKIKMCLVNDPSVSGHIAGVTQDGKIRFVKDSDNSEIAVSTDEIDTCK